MTEFTRSISEDGSGVVVNRRLRFSEFTSTTPDSAFSNNIPNHELQNLYLSDTLNRTYVSENELALFAEGHVDHYSDERELSHR